MENEIDNLSHYGDVLAIPFFALLTYYFYQIQGKTKLEKLLGFFSFSGLVFDILFSLNFLKPGLFKNDK